MLYSSVYTRVPASMVSFMKGLIVFCCTLASRWITTCPPRSIIPKTGGFSFSPTTQRSRHLIRITLIDGQLVSNLLVRQMQSHEIQTQDPHLQRLMMSGKDRVSQSI